MSVKILVVDDNPDILANVRDFFEMKGWTVETATSGTAAAERIGPEAPYDLIVLDVGLPGTDGFTLCRHVRLQGVRTPIVMLTARDSIDDRVEGLSSGADDYVVKPFSLRELAARVEAHLRRSFGGNAARLAVGPRGKTAEEDKRLEEELLSDEKELAEHNMLVDLGRNDIGKISRFGSVQVEKYLSI